jgi:hypothetical protein
MLSYVERGVGRCNRTNLEDRRLNVLLRNEHVAPTSFGWPDKLRQAEL